MLDRKIAPTHPGTILAEALEDMSMKIAHASKLLGCTRQHLHRILNGKAPITPAMAVKIGTLCGNGPTLWANMQTNHDLWHEVRRQKSAIKIIEQHVAA